MTAGIWPDEYQPEADDPLRQTLADALPHEDWCHETDRHPDYPCPCADVRWERAERLPAVVRGLIADHLAAASAEMPTDRQRHEVRQWLHDRAAALRREG